MDQPITVEYQWTYDEFRTARKYDVHRQFRPLFRILSYLIFVALLAASLITFHEKQWDNCFFLSFVAVAWATSPWWHTLWLRHNFRSQVGNGRLLRWSFSPEQITLSDHLGRAEMSWQVVHDIVLTPEGYLIYFTPQNAVWLPRHAFSDEGTYEEVTKLAKEKAKKFSTIK